MGIGEILLDGMIALGWAGSWPNMEKLHSDGTKAIQDDKEWEADKKRFYENHSSWLSRTVPSTRVRHGFIRIQQILNEMGYNG